MFDRLVCAVTTRLVVPVVSFTLSGFVSPTSAQVPDDERREMSDVAFVARVLCRQALSSALVSPSTADYPLLDFSVDRADSEGVYLYRSYVDSQNGFGATVRTHFVCGLRYDGRGRFGSVSSWSFVGLAEE